MKRIAFLLFMLAAFAAQAQKAVKPSLNKIQGLIKDNKWAEAKEMVDAATTFEKTMNDGKTYYYRGLVYAVIDTTSDAQVKALDANAFPTAIKSFDKGDSMQTKSEYFVIGPDGIMPITKSQQMEAWANFYLSKGISAYQDQDDYEGSLALLDKTTKVFETQLDKYANDTLTYYLITLIAQQVEKPELSVAAAEKYFARGGKNKDIYLVLYQLYSADGPMKNTDKALEIVQRAKKELPSDPVFPKIELEILINSGKEKEAKAGLEEAIKKEPNDKLLHFFLGYVNTRLGNVDEARKNFQEAIRIDPQYFQAHYHLANTYLLDVENIVNELKATGNTPADSKKRTELVQKRTKATEAAIPYFEKLEKMKAPGTDDEIELYQKLSLLYYYAADDKNTARVNKKLKDLGVSDE